MRGPGGARSRADEFDLADARANENMVAGLIAVAPTAQTSSQAIHGSANWSTSVTGATNTFLTVQGWVLTDGRVFSEAELKAGKGVCLIGHTVQTELFGAASPIGKAMRLGAISFKVIGTLKEKGQSNFGEDQDDLVVVPLRTMQRRMTGTTDVETILVAVADGVSTQTVKSDIETLLRERRGIKSDQEDDFNVRDMKELIDTLTGTTTP